MALGLVGRKVGMTRIFTEDGVSIPVTVIEATPNRVTQIKSEATDGYNALQVTAGEKKQAVSTNQKRVTSLKLVLKRVVACGNSVLMAVKVSLKLVQLLLLKSSLKFL